MVRVREIRPAQLVKGLSAPHTEGVGATVGNPLKIASVNSIRGACFALQPAAWPPGRTMSKIFSVAALSAILMVSTACEHNSSPGPQPLAPTATSAVPDPATPNTAEQLTGPAVVARVAAQYPERLAAGVSHEQRVANMEFLRDRIIELGNCSGLMLARNRKTNGHLSIDAINWRHGQNDINDVVDVASAYDDTGHALELHWIVVDGPAGWDPIPSSCR